MTQLLLRLFIPDYQDVSKSGVRSAVGKLAGIVGILCNIILFAGKLLAGMLSGSVAIIADAMNNLSDASSSIVTLVGFRLAEKPADEDHPYGHARYEYLAGQIAGLVKKEQTAAEILQEVCTEAETILAGAGRFIE